MRRFSQLAVWLTFNGSRVHIHLHIGNRGLRLENKLSVSANTSHIQIASQPLHFLLLIEATDRHPFRETTMRFPHTRFFTPGDFSPQPRGMQLTLSVCAITIGTALRGYADGGAYNECSQIEVKSRTLTAYHFHDWSRPEIADLAFDAVQDPEIFLSKRNSFAFVCVWNKSGQVLFTSASPALSHLWISPDERYVVGLSNIVLNNPYQLVVWTADGKLINKTHVTSIIAKLTPEQLQKFRTQFPDAYLKLERRKTVLESNTFYDFNIGGMPNIIGEQAFYFLFDHHILNPLSAEVSESVTNSVTWFNAKAPGVSIEETNGLVHLHLQSPAHRRIEISLADPSN